MFAVCVGEWKKPTIIVLTAAFKINVKLGEKKRQIDLDLDLERKTTYSAVCSQLRTFGKISEEKK